MRKVLFFVIGFCCSATSLNALDGGKPDFDQIIVTQRIEHRSPIVVGIMSGGLGSDVYSQYTIIQKQLADYYEIRTVSPGKSIDSDIDVLLVFRPEKFSKTACTTIDQFILSGKGTLIATNLITVTMAGTK